MNALRDFAARERLRLRWGEDNTAFIPGKAGHLYEFSPDRLAVVYLGSGARAWGNRRRAGVAAGMQVLQCGDCEGCLLFDPDNPEQAALAIKVAHVNRRPRRRPLSDEQRARLAAMASSAAAARWHAIPAPTARARRHEDTAGRQVAALA